MFFPLSKILWGLVQPSHLIAWLALAAVALLFTGHVRGGRLAAALAAALLLGIGVVPSYQWLDRPLETEYRRGPLPAHIDGILTLGGGIDYRVRLVSTYALARQYPDAKVVYSGGSGSLLDNQPNTEANTFRRTILALGLEPRRLTLEGRSRNTWENILFTQKLVKPRPGDVWVLATSAYHLPRAMEIAHRLNWKFIPWPTDYTLRRPGAGFFDIPENLWAFDNALREWIGIAAYRLSGRSQPAS